MTAVAAGPAPAGVQRVLVGDGQVGIDPEFSPVYMTVSGLLPQNGENRYMNPRWPDAQPDFSARWRPGASYQNQNSVGSQTLRCAVAEADQRPGPRRPAFPQPSQPAISAPVEDPKSLS
jgi:hypothetical protein